MAADSLATVDGVRFYNAKKIKRLSNGALLGLAGDSDLCCRTAIKLNKIASVRQIVANDLKGRGEVQAVYLCKEGIYRFMIGKYYSIEKIDNEVFADGCGFKLALAAMMCGASPEEACRVACELDTACGLPVQVEVL
jgi:hypothetical protein